MQTTRMKKTIHEKVKCTSLVFQCFSEVQLSSISEYFTFSTYFCLAGKEKDTVQNKAPESPPSRRSLVHPLDQHKLLYILHYDSQLTLYAFTTLQTILTRSPHQFVCASSTTSISSSNTPHQEKIKELLIRHRRSLLGKGFYGALYESAVSPTGMWESL